MEKSGWKVIEAKTKATPDRRLMMMTMMMVVVVAAMAVIRMTGSVCVGLRIYYVDMSVSARCLLCVTPVPLL